MVVVNYIYDMVVDTQFRKFHGRTFARVVYLFLMKDIGRGLPWVPPGSTGRFYKDRLRCFLAISRAKTSDRDLSRRNIFDRLQNAVNLVYFVLKSNRSFARY